MERYCKQCRRMKPLEDFERNEKFLVYEDKAPYLEIVDHINYDKSIRRQCRECNNKKCKNNHVNLKR